MRAEWAQEEWDYFLRDLCGQLHPGGRIEFELNPLPDGRHMEPALRWYFRARLKRAGSAAHAYTSSKTCRSRPAQEARGLTMTV